MEKKEIAHLKINGNKPTVVSLNLLQEWVIWQYPKKAAKGFCGAVHPPLQKHGWLPAIIHPDKNEAHVHGHLEKIFETPEMAADYISANGKN